MTMGILTVSMETCDGRGGMPDQTRAMLLTSVAARIFLAYPELPETSRSSHRRGVRKNAIHHRRKTSSHLPPSAEHRQLSTACPRSAQPPAGRRDNHGCRDGPIQPASLSGKTHRRSHLL